jgi:hypothetical protein
MKIDRESLVRHLQRIVCGNQVTEVVFSGAFETAALTPDNLLLVLAPSLAKTRPLFKDPVGVAELAKLVKALSVLAGSANEAAKVNVAVEKHRLVVDEGERGVLRLMTAEPRTIATSVEQETVDKLLAKAPALGKDGIPLTRQLVEGIRSTFSLFNATEVSLFVGPDGGKVRVGNTNSDLAEFESEQLKASKEYALLFGAHFVQVLGVITNYTEAMLYLGGPKSFVLIDDGGYKYLMSPQAKSEDAA